MRGSVVFTVARGAHPKPAKTTMTANAVWIRRNVLSLECRDFIEIQWVVENDSSAISFSSF
jgi:hypothetical protein